MDIKELRKKYNITRKQLSEFTGIPVRTIQSWELGEREAPDYIYSLIETKLDTIIKATDQKTILVPSTNIDLADLNRILLKDFYSISVEDISKINKALTNQMINERTNKDRGGIYGYTQRALAYNSSKIEGNHLTEDETQYLFELNQLPEGEFRAKDVEEMTGHFLMFNYMLSNINGDLSEDIIKGMHRELQSGAFEFRANGGIPGEYKHRKNIVGNITTSDPTEVKADILQLIKDYTTCLDDNYSNGESYIKPLSFLHARYEQIHPFQDGNGRTGRMILFRECLNNDRIPFIIKDETKRTYYDALKQAQLQGNYDLLDKYFVECQAAYYKTIQELMYDHSITLNNDSIDIERE